jgi:hypothetical protein
MIRSLNRRATLKMRMGATHFLMKQLKNVATEMALNVLARDEYRRRQAAAGRDAGLRSPSWCDQISPCR